MTEYEKMLNGQVFDGGDAKISEVRDRAFEIQYQIQQARTFPETQPLFRQLLGHLGEGSFIRPPFSCEFGQQVSIGEHSFLNTGVDMLDGATITIGNNVLIGPNVQFYTPSHPMDYSRRRLWETRCLPITVEDDVWIGGNVVINQGVTIGARSVIAAGSVVNEDIPVDSLVGGVPAKLIKRLV